MCKDFSKLNELYFSCLKFTDMVSLLDFHDTVQDVSSKMADKNKSMPTLIKKLKSMQCEVHDNKNSMYQITCSGLTLLKS